jgi:hypothetical protein
MATKKNFSTFFCLLHFKATLRSFFKDKTGFIKKSQNSRNQGFSYYFCLMIKGSGSGSVPRTNRSGYGSLKTYRTDPTDSDPDPQHCCWQYQQHQERPRVPTGVLNTFSPVHSCACFRPIALLLFGQRDT